MEIKCSKLTFRVMVTKGEGLPPAHFQMEAPGFSAYEFLSAEQARQMAFALLAVVGEGEDDEPVAPSLPEDHPANTAMMAGCEAALRFEAAEKDYYQQNWLPAQKDFEVGWSRRTTAPDPDDVAKSEHVTWDPASEVDCVDWRDQEKAQLRAIDENDTELSELQEFDRRRAAHSLHRIEGLGDAS